MRVTKAMLEAACERLNKDLGRNPKPWSKDDNNVWKAHVGTFYVSYGYQWVSLHYIYNDGGGVVVMFGAKTKREFYALLQAYMAGIQQGIAHAKAL